MENLIAFLNSDVNTSMNNNSDMITARAGYANGYVAVPPEHPWFDKSCDEVEGEITIHGGLTFSAKSEDCVKYWKSIEIISDSDTIPTGWWVFGFDTMHFDDNLNTWPRERCVKETLRLKQQLENAWGKQK